MHTCLAKAIELYEARALVTSIIYIQNIYAYQHPVTCRCYTTTESITNQQ